MDQKPTRWSHLLPKLRQHAKSPLILILFSLIVISGLSTLFLLPSGLRGTNQSTTSAGATFSTVASNGMSSSVGPMAAANGSPQAMNAPMDSSTDFTTNMQLAKTQIPHLVIDSASFTVSVANIDAASTHITQMTSTATGFIQSLNQSTDNNHTTVVMTLRIPEPQFPKFLNNIKTLGTVRDFTQTGQDVTEQSNNLQTQITQLQNEAQAFARLYNKAQAMKDMLDIQQALSQINSQISSLTSQQHDLNRSVQLATVTVTLVPAGSTISQQHTSFIRALTSSIHFMGRSGIAVLALIGWLLPWCIFIGFLVFGWRSWSKWRKNAKH